MILRVRSQVRREVNDVEIVLDHDRHSFACVDPRKDFTEGRFVVYLGGRDMEREVAEPFAHESGCLDPKRYIERYIEQILSHETLHWAIFNSQEELGWKLAACTRLDAFDNWGLNPISFHSSTSTAKEMEE